MHVSNPKKTREAVLIYCDKSVVEGKEKPLELAVKALRDSEAGLVGFETAHPIIAPSAIPPSKDDLPEPLEPPRAYLLNLIELRLC